jgi:hypothetical protein
MSYVRAEQIATAIRFKEYLLGRDVQSRRVLIDFFIKWTLQQGGMPEIVAWFEMLKHINPILNTMQSDVHWDELLLAYSHDSDFLQMISMFSA